MSEDSLPLRQWPGGIQQASVPANDNALRVQALLSRALSVENDAPGTEYNGAVYIVGDTPVGAFAAFAEHDIALFEYGSWYAWAPVLGSSMVIGSSRMMFDGTEWIADPAGGGGGAAWGAITGTLSDQTDLQAALDAKAGDAYTIVTESSAFTADPSTHDGLTRYIRAGGNVTFNSAEPYTAGMVFNIRATAGLDLVESGVTLTPPAGGTLELDAGMAVQVVMTSSTTADVIGQTVAA